MTSGTCRIHNKEFVIEEGCPLCLAAKKGDWTNPIWEAKQTGQSPPSVGSTTANSPILEVVSSLLIPTALIKIKPDADESVVKLYQESCKLLDVAQARVIETDEDVKVVAHVATKAGARDFAETVKVLFREETSH